MVRRCSRCGANWHRCTFHNPVRRINRARQRRLWAAQKRKHRSKRRASGECMECGYELPKPVVFRRCLLCRKKGSRYRRQSRIKNLQAQDGRVAA